MSDIGGACKSNYLQCNNGGGIASVAVAAAEDVNNGIVEVAVATTMVVVAVAVCDSTRARAPSE